VFLDRDCRVRLFTPAIRGLIELRRRDLGRPIIDFARTFDDDALIDDAKTVIATSTSLDAVVRGHDDRWFLRRIVPYRTERGRVDGVVVSFTDITARRAAEESLRRINEQLESRVDRRTALVTLLQDVAVIANSAMPMAEAFEAALDRVCRDVSWIAGHVYLNRLGTAEDIGVWHARTPLNPDGVRELLGGRSFEPGEWLVGRVIEGGGACWSSDLTSDSRFRRREASALGVRSVLVFPVLVGERVVGALEFFSGAINEPGPRLLEVMRNIGTQLGRVIEREEARERMIDLAIEEQRSLGEELHDTLSQQIYGLTMLAQSLVQSPPAPGGEDERPRTLVDGLQDAHRHVRVLSRGLVPVRVDADGLDGALGEMAREWEQLYGTACVFEHEGVTAGADDERIATALYRIAREAARNAVLHGGARRIVIRLVTTADQLELQVRDDGFGMEEVPLQGPGMGLQIMQHRAEIIGGTLEIESAPGRGTVVRCRIAVDRGGMEGDRHEA
jgi:signal transduction histidine kinase